MTKVFTKTEPLISYLKNKKEIGFVPTMGNLHDGHLSLLKMALQENDIAVLSIYINPTQFDDHNDLMSYPRSFAEDVKRARSIVKDTSSLIIFHPESDLEIYPQNKSLIPAVGPIDLFEGAIRPGHFDGMATVVHRLFEIVRPKRAYFGKKDYQQLLIVQNLATQYFPTLKIIPVETERNSMGLALSSRNSRLDPKQMEEALTLRNTMIKLRKDLQESKNIGHIQELIKEILAKDSRFNYLALVAAKSLLTPQSLTEKLVILGNFQISDIRLLDNLEI